MRGPAHPEHKVPEHRAGPLRGPLGPHGQDNSQASDALHASLHSGCVVLVWPPPGGRGFHHAVCSHSPCSVQPHTILQCHLQPHVLLRASVFQQERRDSHIFATLFKISLPLDKFLIYGSREGGGEKGLKEHKQCHYIPALIITAIVFMRR